MYYLLFKSLHLIAMVAWFAGLFYLVRIFVYHTEAFDKSEQERDVLTAQYAVMASRLYRIICNPAMVLTWIFGLSMLYMNGLTWLKENPWMHVKLTFVVLLFIYHLMTHGYYKQLQADIVKKSSSFMRLWNEGATFILFAVIFLVILKSAFNWIFGVIGLIVLGILIMLGYKVYKNIRAKNPNA